MPVASRTPETRADRRPIEAAQLGFTLSFVSGKGLLTTRDVKLGPFDLRVLELEIPHIKFPFDVTGGAERFKTRRCELKHLTLSVSGESIAELVASTNAAEMGFVELKTAMRDGHIELAGRLASGEAAADFTMRAALLPRALDELALVFYDTRVYGWLPIPSSLLPTLLRKAIDVPFLTATAEGERASAWMVRPAQQFMREIMPLLGWKIPDTSRVAIAEAQLSRGQLVVAIGPQGEPSQKQILEHKPPDEAALVHEGTSLFDEAEVVLSEGKLAEAYDLYRTALDDDRASKFVRERLLQIGSADPDLALETRQLAEEMLAKNAQDTQALLALAAIALRERAFGEASNRFDQLGELARARKERFDAIAAELASAGAAAHIDPAAAIAGYERATSRARDSVVAHRALFELRQVAGDWDKAAKVGERLSRLEREPAKRAVIFKQLGHLAREHLSDLKKARIFFERALKLSADDPEALEGLAETFAARGEPARAASYLARLAEQAEASGDLERIVTLNLRLGEIWERWLGDLESASARYLRVLDAKPRHRVARLRLAELAEKSGDTNRARVMLEEIVALEDEATDETLVHEVALAYTRLARIVIASDGMTAEAIASLERAVELDPELREARDQLGTVLRERGEWARLVQLLATSAKATTDKIEAKRARLEAARLEMQHRGDVQAAQQHLDQIVDETADDAEALDMLLPILRDQGDFAGMMERVVQAADVTPEPVRKARYLLELARAREALGMDPESRRRALEDALDANPYLLEAAETLVQLLEDYDDNERLVRALGRLAVATTSPDVRADALLRQGRLLWQQLKRPQDAEEALREAVRLEPGNFSTWTALSRLLESIGKMEEAREVLQRALIEADRRSAPKGPIHERLAELARARDDADDEAQELLLAVQAGLRTERLGNRLVQVLSHLGRLVEAATLLEEWAGESQAPGRESEMLLYKAAELRRSMGEVERASAIYRDLLARRGDAALASARALEKIAESRNDWDTVANALAYELEVDNGANPEPLLTRMVEAQARRRDWVQLESFAERLVSLDGTSIVGRWNLAQCLLRIENFHEALFHIERLLMDGPLEDAGPLAAIRKGAYSLASALAMEIDPAMLESLHDAVANEMPDAAATMTTPFGAMLAEAGEWTRLLALRRVQLERAVEPRATELRRDVANILHERLSRSDESIPFYQDVIAADPTDIASRDALVSVFEKLGRWGDLANHLFALSQLVADPEQALDYGLRGVEVYSDQLHDQAMGTQVLRALISSVGLDPDDGRLMHLLQALEMHAEHAHVLSMSLEKAPSPDDGRLATLVDLIDGPLEQPGVALEWAQRYVTLFPDANKPRELVADLMMAHPHLGDVRGWLERWAKDRQGRDRAPVLARLAEVLRSEGKDDDARKVLEKAAEYDPRDEALLTRLIDRTTAQGDWERTVYWLEQLAFLEGADTTTRDERLRKLIEVATDFADDSAVAIRALQALSARNRAEDEHLAQLWVETGDIVGIRDTRAIVEQLSSSTILAAARHVAIAADFELARDFLDVVLARGDGGPAWELATELWTGDARRIELANWRLEVADRTAKTEEAAALRIEGLTDLIALGQEVRDEDVRTALDGVDLTDLRTTYGAFQLARVIRDEAWEMRTAAALEVLLPSDDARLADVIVSRTRIALRRGDAAGAVPMARKLVALGDDRGDKLLDEALEKSGDIDELVRTLAARADTKAHAEAAPLWMRVATIEVDRNDDAAALVALEHIHEDERDLTWGRLMYDVAQRMSDVQRRADSARTIARFTADEVSRADWLRTAARLTWWELGDEAAAHELLSEAQRAAPEERTEILTRANEALASGDPPTARRALLEGLAVISGEAQVSLWLRLADVDEAAGNREDATRALERATQVAPDDATMFVNIGERAERVLATDLALGALAKAMRLDTRYEELYLDALIRAQRWDKAVVVLENRADELKGREAALRLARAAEITRDHLSDEARALDLLERAALLDEDETTLRGALALAQQLHRSTAIVDIIERLDSLKGDTLPDWLQLTRVQVTALDELGREDDTAPLRERLVQGGQGVLNDLLVLARVLEAEAPLRAARYLRDAAMDPQLTQQPEVLVRAALAFDRQGELDEARPLIAEALERGVDTIEAHQLSAELLTGEVRLRSIARLVTDGADASWDRTTRASARMELADWYASGGALEEARLALVDTAQFDKPAGWVQALEAVLEAQGRELDLAGLWLDEATGTAAGWSPAERNARVSRAAAIYHRIPDDAGEYRALELLSRFTPDDERVRERLMEVIATLGDSADFVRRVEEQLGAAATPEARAEVVLRYAGVLDERFEQGDRAIALALAAFEEIATLEIARLLRTLMVRHGRARELAQTLHTRALSQQAPDDRPMLVLAAAISRENAHDEALTYTIMRDLHGRYADDDAARDVVLMYAEAHGLHDDLVKALRISAGAAPDAEQAFIFLVRAADVAADALKNEDLEVELLDMALGAQSGNTIVTRRVFDLHVKRIELEAALALLQGEGWEHEDELEAGIRLVQALRGVGSNAEADTLAAWLAERHAETAFAADVRLAKARASHDRASVLREVEARLASVKDLRGSEWVALHSEAGEAAIALGDLPVALRHFIAAVDTPDPSPEALRRAAQLAYELGDDNRTIFIIQSASSVREAITTRAIQARGDDRVEWLYLLGQAHEAASDPNPAVEAYRQAVSLSDGPVHERSFQALEHLYRKRGEWQLVADLHADRASRAKSPLDKADSTYKKAMIWREYLFDEDGAEKALEEALEIDPTHAAATLELGLLYFAKQNYAAALPLLQDQLDSRGDDAPIEHWLALLDCLRETGNDERALAVSARILAREADHSDVRMMRAQLLDKLGRETEAANEWRSYVEAAPGDAAPETVASVHEKLAKHALRVGDRGQALQHYEAAYQLTPEALPIIRGMRQLHETDGRYPDAAALRARELALTSDPKEQLEQHVALARIFGEHLGDTARALKHLEKAHDLAPADLGLTRELFGAYDKNGDGKKLAVIGDHLIEASAPGALDAAFFARMGKAYEEDVGDAERAKDLYARAFAAAPKSRELQDAFQRLALATGDYAAWAPLEENAIESVSDQHERSQRYQALADIVARQLGAPGKAAALMLKARELDPTDVTMTRRLADTYALDPNAYGKAAELYRALLDADPLNTDLLKILARLSGQVGDTDRAYGYYAALLVLIPSDAEGKRFVAACRNAMPPGPQRAITDADRQGGLVHPDQAGPVEELFAPLARFAELTQPGNLKLRGVDERDVLAATDDRVKWLMRVLEPLGLAQAVLYLWRGGGFACEAELVGTPTILLGSTLASDASQRQRAFLTARTAELYRSGHTLCERLPPMELEALAAALCMALLPGAKVPGTGNNSTVWSGLIAQPMTDQIRSALRDRAKSYIAKYGELDLGKWRRACLATAGRVALLLSCDVEDAIAAMLRLRGFDDISDDQRPAVLTESPEELDLFRFSLSDAYFKLRESVGMALRRAK